MWNRRKISMFKYVYISMINKLRYARYNGEYFPRNIQPRSIMKELTDNLSNVKIHAISFNNITSATFIAVDRLHSCERNDRSYENAAMSLLCTQFLNLFLQTFLATLSIILDTQRRARHKFSLMATSRYCAYFISPVMQTSLYIYTYRGM
jgi:hypothetical protein